MAFKPKNVNTNTPREFVKLPTPVGGNQPARVSMIVDLGDQPQYYKDKDTGVETLSTKSVQEVAVFADLVDQEVDYGGEIGVKQYRMMLNDQWFGEVKGCKFAQTAPKDGEGKIIPNKIWTFHPRNLLYRLAGPCGCSNILGANEKDNMDIEQLLGKAFMIDVEVIERLHKDGKLDDKGEVIKYHNVKWKAIATVPVISKQPMPVEELTSPAMLVSFDTATEEQVKMLRRDIIKKIQMATNYEGSVIQGVIQKLGLTVEEKAVVAPQTAVESVEDDTPEQGMGDTEDAPDDVTDGLDSDEPF